MPSRIQEIPCLYQQNGKKRVLHLLSNQQDTFYGGAAVSMLLVQIAKMYLAD